jgi:hypothetical protein
MPSRTRSAIALALVSLVVLAGCMGGGGGGAGGGVEVASNDGGLGGGNGSGGAGAGGSAASAQVDGEALQAGQARIKTGRVRLEVTNVSSATMQNLTRATRRRGGYVSAASATTQTIDGTNRTTGQMVLRVPRGNFSALFGRVTAAGAVQNRNQNATDVSGRLVDLRARLNNSRAQRERLRSLYLELARESRPEATGRGADVNRVSLPMAVQPSATRQ